VRGLEREIGKVCRVKAVEYSSVRDGNKGSGYEKKVGIEDVERILGMAKFEQEVREEKHRPGVVT
jgi:ATP-dependent Lon protease